MEAWAILKQGLQVTAFVTAMMISVEYLNVLTRGAWPESLAAARWKQYLVAVALGASPGCLGAFAVVTLYTHRMVSFGALVACMIATAGDESFVMFALFPEKAMVLTVALALVGLVAGIVTDLLIRKPPLSGDVHKFVLHEEDSCRCFEPRAILRRLRSLNAARGILGISAALFFLAIATGMIGPDSWNWLRWTMLLICGAALFIVWTVPDHFLQEHLWKHIALQHVPRIFAWTLLALIVVAWIQRSDPAGSMIGENRWSVLGAAGLIGIIPESGPHLLFVTLYSKGVAPISVLVAGSIVQDGHGMLPLLAFSRRQFVEVKAINLAVGILVGAALMLAGF